MDNLPATTTAKPVKSVKIRLSDLKLIADLVATRRLTEKEACAMLNLRYNRWLSWKSLHKNNAVFEKAIERIKARKITGYLNDIDRIADGSPELKMKPDWRAKAFMLGVTDNRFQPKASEQTVNNNSVTMNLVSDALKRVFIDDTKPERVITVIPARKLIN